jgi:hypothetical protein
MSRSWTTVVLWAVFLGVLTAVTAPFGAGVYTYGLLGGAALLTLAIGILVLGVNGPGDATAPPASDRAGLSYPAMMLGLGLAGAALGAEVGLWLVLIGAGLCVIAIAGLVREWRAGRRPAEEV